LFFLGNAISSKRGPFQTGTFFDNDE
jgi:hypothetical protein